MSETLYEHYARLYGADRVHWRDDGTLVVNVPVVGEINITFHRGEK